MSNLIVILFNHFSLYLCEVFNCKGYVWDSVKTQAYIEEQVDFMRSSRETREKLTREESWQPEVFASVSW